MLESVVPTSLTAWFRETYSTITPVSMLITNTALELDTGPADKLAIDFAVFLLFHESIILDLASCECFRPK